VELAVTTPDVMGSITRDASFSISRRFIPSLVFGQEGSRTNLMCGPSGDEHEPII
jgi:hypothetical protein